MSRYVPTIIALALFLVALIIELCVAYRIDSLDALMGVLK